MKKTDAIHHTSISGVHFPFFTTLFHLVTFLGYLYTLYYDLSQLPSLGHRETYGGRSKFLTFWNLCIQLTFFGYSLINDIAGSNTSDVKNRSTLQVIRDRLAACVVFPCGLLVVGVFWGIYAVDRELIFPKALDSIVPAWLNHAWHTTVIVFLLIEKILVQHHYPSRVSGLTTAILFGLSYQIWIFWIAYASGIWVYPVLEVLAWPLRILFLAICWTLLTLVYFIGEFVTKFFWCADAVQQKKDYITKKVK